MVEEFDDSFISISNISEITFNPKSEKLNLSDSDLGFSLDIFLYRAGVNHRFRKFRTLIETPTNLVEIGILTAGEANPEININEESKLLCFDMQNAIKLLFETAEQKRAVGNSLLNLLVDVSCLPRLEQGLLFAALGELTKRIKLRLGLGYSLSRYSPPPQKWGRPVSPVAPVHPCFGGWGDPFLPIHLVVGLGYEAGKAFGAVQLLEPAKCTPLIPNSPEGNFLISVNNENRDFLKSYPESLSYEVLQPARTYFSLASLVSGIQRTHRAILLPFGPKILFSVSLLVALTHPEVSVWFVEGEDCRQSDDGTPSGDASLLVCELER